MHILKRRSDDILWELYKERVVGIDDYLRVSNMLMVTDESSFSSSLLISPVRINISCQYTASFKGAQGI